MTGEFIDKYGKDPQRGVFGVPAGSFLLPRLSELDRAGVPIVIYGTGDAAEKILAIFAERGIKVSGIFASDGFVRSRSFAGFPVLSYAQAKERFGKMAVVLAFGSHLPDVLAAIDRIASEQDLYAPDLPVGGGPLFDAEFAEEHIEDLARARARLADRQSVLVFDSVVRYKLTGRVSYLRGCETPPAERYPLLGIGPSETFVDLGAYTGDTVASFAGYAGSWERIYAVEPEARNFRKLAESTAGMENCELFNMAVSSGPGEIGLSVAAGRGSAEGKGKVRRVPCDSLDNILAGRRASFIKMDLEGQEEAALIGAERTIRGCHPKLLISAYHKSSDLWSLPDKVLDMDPSYRLSLRHSPCLPAWEIDYLMV